MSATAETPTSTVLGAKPRIDPRRNQVTGPSVGRSSTSAVAASRSSPTVRTTSDLSGRDGGSSGVALLVTS